MLRPPALALLVLLSACSRSASAQTPFEISGGYSAAHDPRDDVTLRAGWVAGAALSLTRTVSVVGDVSGQYRTVELFATDVRLSVQTVMGGVRASARLGRLIEFGQVVAGVVHTSGSAFGSTDTGNSVGVQPGVGVDYPLTDRVAARAQFDVRLIRHQADATNGGHQYRFVAALAYRIRPH